MSLSPGLRVGPYEIVSSLGAGGMGEVYRAHDTKLNREVAIKVLPDLLAADPERRARFEREAQTLAALNHPNIAQIYGVEEGPSAGSEQARSTDSGQAPAPGSGRAGVRALVMELVEGPTLADLIAGSARPRSSGAAIGDAPVPGAVARRIPVEDAIRIARQVAEALEAAHAAGIVHRDLKPANIKVRPDGVVKVLDFGLARIIITDALGDSATAESPTVVSPVMTAQGIIVGTAAYMAPEQARGHVADARSDIWAFGVVLYEMLTGTPLFRGATVSDVLASVLRDAPRWELLPPDTPPHVRRLLRRCLQKDPPLRLHHAGDARIELLEPDGADVADAPGQEPRRMPRAVVALAGLLVAAAVGGAFLAGLRWAPAPEVPLRKWAIPHDELPAGFTRLPAISPDGQRLAYMGVARLRISTFSSLESHEVPVDGIPATPTWSPDSTALAFTADDATLWRVPATGGAPTKLCELPVGVVMGMAWRPDATIVVNVSHGPGSGSLFTVAEGGGVPRPLAANGAIKGDALYWLRGLPDGSLVYTRQRRNEFASIVEGAGKPARSLPLNGFWFTYSPTGHLVYQGGPGQEGIWAVGFDLRSREMQGKPFRIAETGTGPTAGAGGMLAYDRSVGGRSELAWVDRNGAVRGSIGQPQDQMFSPVLSPSGTRVAVLGTDGGATSIWVHEVNRGTKSRLTFGTGISDAQEWRRDESRVAFVQNWRLFTVTSDGGEPTPLVPPPGTSSTAPVPPLLSATWSAGDRHLVITQFMPTTKSDILILDAGATQPRAVLQSPFNEGQATLSPEARHMAYLSDETGRSELFVRTFPDAGGKIQVSSSGAAFPRWSPRGNEIFFVEGHTLMAVPVRTTPTLQIGAPQRLFDLEPRGAVQRIYDTLDGERFVMVRTVSPGSAGVIIVQNWFEEFRRR